MGQQTVLITGATGKLGRVFAQGLADAGWKVIVTSRSSARAAALAEAISRKGGDVTGVKLDLTCNKSVDTLVDTLATQNIVLTHLVNNARSLDSLSVEEDGLTSRRAFHCELQIDVIEPYRLLMSIALDSRHPLSTVVNVGSFYGEVAPNPALYGGSLKGSPIQYGVAKAALAHLTRELAVRLAPKVRVNCVAFGGFSGRTDENFVSRYENLVPNGRMLDETEAVGPVRFLLSDESSAINGHVLLADGGWSIW